jgi:eukaryotic-like serine/threonine-protein kinase
LKAAHSPGQIIDGRFTLREILGTGAFGSVWRAVDQTDGNVVALKLLHRRYRESPKSLQRFVQEARLQHELEHPCIAKSLGWSLEGGAYLAMEYINGETLAQRIATHSQSGQPIPLRGVAWLVDQLCGAIEHAHQHRVIHRDLKPGNVMVNHPRGQPFLKVLDFGIAKMLVGGEVDPTTFGRVLGSILYLSPEQVRREPVDERTDVFSLGAVAFEALTLRRAWARTDQGEPLPFHLPTSGTAANSQFAVLQRIEGDVRPSVHAIRPDVPPAVDEVFAKVLCKDPRERYQTPTEFALAFRVALLEAPEMLNRSNSVTPTEEPSIDTLVEHE